MIKKIIYDAKIKKEEILEYYTEEELVELEKNIPLTLEEKYKQLEQAMLETTALLAEEQEKNKQNEQAILELSMLATGGNLYV